MWRNGFFLMVLALTGCIAVPCDCATPTIGVTPGVTETAVPSATLTPAPVWPTNTALPPTATLPPLPTSTPEPVTPAGNLLRNPGFEGNYIMQAFQTAPSDTFAFAEINVAPEWKAYGCWFPYTYQYQGYQDCPAYRRVPNGGNPADLLLRRPEYKPAEAHIAANRVHSGERAQQWFSMWGTMQAGVYQTVTGITPGSTCEVGGYVQSWTTSRTDIFTSDSTTTDQRENMQWLIRVAQGDSILRFDGNGANLVSRNFIFDHYDKYLPMTYTFTATASTVTVGFETIVLYPVINNNAYLDDAWLECIPPQPLATPTPIVSGTPSAPSGSYQLRNSAVTYTSSAGFGTDCNRAVIGGNVLNAGMHQPGLTVKVVGPDNVIQERTTGSAAAYGLSGWEVTVATRPVEAVYRVQLWQGGQQVSEVQAVQLINSCALNVALLTFEQ